MREQARLDAACGTSAVNGGSTVFVIKSCPMMHAALVRSGASRGVLGAVSGWNSSAPIGGPVSA